MNDSQIRILVVDDENIVLSLIRDALEEEEYDIRTASTGAEALEIIDSTPINLIVTDIRMPGITGIELVKKARKVQPDMGVIFMTGYANLNSAKDAIKQGAFDYILKPFELDEIRRAIKNAVHKIKKEAAEKSPDQQLEHLSDLNQQLIMVGDRSTLCTVSLRFAMMHCQSELGAILYWDKAHTTLTKITIDEKEPTEETLPESSFFESLAYVDTRRFHSPVIVTNLEEHPLYHERMDIQEGKRILFPRWMSDGGNVQMIVVPVVRAETLLGLIMIGFATEATLVKKADLKLLSISASQLALSLENLELLEETQHAYARLKELQDETIQLEKMATRGEMSAEIGHELNNFLGVVTGNLSLLDFQLKKGNYDELEKYVHAMTDNIEKIKKFTSNLMDLTPISSKKDIISFAKLLREVVDYLKPQRRFQNVTIEVEKIDEEFPFEGDSIHIQQLLYNLFNNAADASLEQKERKITVRCERNDDKTFTFHIQDTGSGIEPELQNKLFNERFTTKKNGHGFGLVVCKRIVDSHGGSIHIESSLGKGTMISITFPLAQTQPAALTTA